MRPILRLALHLCKVTPPRCQMRCAALAAANCAPHLPSQTSRGALALARPRALPAPPPAPCNATRQSDAHQVALMPLGGRLDRLRSQAPGKHAGQAVSSAARCDAPSARRGRLLRARRRLGRSRARSKLRSQRSPLARAHRPRLRSVTRARGAEEGRQRGTEVKNKCASARLSRGWGGRGCRAHARVMPCRSRGAHPANSARSSSSCGRRGAHLGDPGERVAGSVELAAAALAVAVAAARGGRRRLRGGASARHFRRKAGWRATGGGRGL